MKVITQSLFNTIRVMDELINLIREMGGFLVSQDPYTELKRDTLISNGCEESLSYGKVAIKFVLGDTYYNFILGSSFEMRPCLIKAKVPYGILMRDCEPFYLEHEFTLKGNGRYLEDEYEDEAESLLCSLIRAPYSVGEMQPEEAVTRLYQIEIECVA